MSERKSPICDDKSSSTEGPDSPNVISPSTSPIQVPPSPEYDEMERSVSFPPLYAAHFIDRVSNDENEALKYRIKVRRNVCEEYRILERTFEDFLYLHNKLKSNNIPYYPGIIVPPFPFKSKSPKVSFYELVRLGKEDFTRQKKNMEKYMNLILCHPILGRDPDLLKFMEEPTIFIEPIKKEFSISSLVSHIELSRKPNQIIEEPDPSFATETEWIKNYTEKLKDTLLVCYQINSLRAKLAQQLGAISLEFELTRKQGDILHPRLRTKVSKSIDKEKNAIEKSALSEERTLGDYLELYEKYLESANITLGRRTSCLQKTENILKDINKTKDSERLNQLNITKENAEKEFEDCSELAQKELKRFHRRRTVELKEALITFAQGQIRSARESSSSFKKMTHQLSKISMED